MRSARQYTDTGLYHIVIRGVNKQNIFFDDTDKLFFISLLQKYGEKYKIKLHAYCLMANHVHLQIEDPNKNISSYMQTINSIYARFFNRKYDRIGHLFQNRFISECINDNSYYKQVFRYILQNPEKAGICRINEYKWSSYQLYKGNRKTFISMKPISFFYNKEDMYDFINQNSDLILLDIEMRPSEKEFFLIAKIKNLLHTNTTIIKPDLPLPEIMSKVKLLKAANISIRNISRLTGIMTWIVYQA